MAYSSYPEHALMHYAIGVAIGAHALGPGFPGKLPWRHFGKRPFLRCLHGLALSMWRIRRDEDARMIFERLMSLDPEDGQGVLVAWSELRAGWPWGDPRSH